MSSFDLTIPIILQHEGGWVNNPFDPGGETNFGISMLIIKREKLTLEQLGIDNWESGCLKKMTVETAKNLYNILFWDRYGYQACADQTIATKICDCAVNCGPGRAATMAQKAANACGQNLTVDGILGPHSFATINAIDPKTYVHAYADQMRTYYNGIVAANPKLKVFLTNWIKRSTWGE